MCTRRQSSESFRQLVLLTPFTDKQTEAGRQTALLMPVSWRWEVAEAGCELRSAFCKPRPPFSRPALKDSPLGTPSALRPSLSWVH